MWQACTPRRGRYAPRLSSGVRPMHARFWLLTLLALSFRLNASSEWICSDPPVREAFARSDVAVAATVAGVSTKRTSDGTWRQTILWRVDENWKGRHYKGSQFTTRTLLAEPETVGTGESFVLLLSGTEPYKLASPCTPERPRLKDSLYKVHQLYQEFDRLREHGPNNSFKPRPLRGSA